MRALLALLLAGALAPPASATPPTSGGEEPAATVRAPFLQRAPGARSVALGESWAASDGSIQSVATNPGGLGMLSALSAQADVESGTTGGTALALAAGLPVGPGAVGVHVLALRQPAWDLRDDAGLKTGSDEAMDVAATVAFGMRLPATLGGRGAAGVGVEVGREAVGTSVVAMDLGGIVPLGSGFAAGIALRHLGPPAGGYPLPSELRAGAAWSRGAFSACADAGRWLAEKKSFASAGVEARVSRGFTVRGGYRVVPGGEGWGGLAGMSLGLGFGLRNLHLDYAYQPFGDLASDHHLSLCWARSP